MRKGRFETLLDPMMREFNSSLAEDMHLLAEDIEASKAHARELHRLGLVSAEELSSLLDGLDFVHRGIRDGSISCDPELEDIHMNVEVLLGRFTPAAARLHTARSRNDQVATDLRLYCRDRATELASASLDLVDALLRHARRSAAWPMPEYTHLQPAQVGTLGHHLAAWCFGFLRDCGRFIAAREAASRLALGSGAGVGVGYRYDRGAVARDLEMEPPAESSLDAVSDRDFALDLLHACAVTAGRLSRLGGEMVLWSTREFGFVTLSEGFSSGSSIMPQKRNPDAAELLRARAARAAGRLVSLHQVLAGCGLGYSKDLQESKPPVIEAVESAVVSLAIAMGMVQGLSFHRDRMLAATADPGLYAVDMVDTLVARGAPFRRAHEAVGKLMRRLADDRNAEVREMTPAVLAGIDPLLASLDPASMLDPARSIEARASDGGPSAGSMRKILASIARSSRGLRKRVTSNKTGASSRIGRIRQGGNTC